MARYKVIDTNPRLLPVNLAAQLLPGTFAYFGPSRSLVSLEVDHPLRSKPITHFGRSRSPVSLEADHPFRLMAITR